MNSNCRYSNLFLVFFCILSPPSGSVVINYHVDLTRTDLQLVLFLGGIGRIGVVGRVRIVGRIDRNCRKRQIVVSIMKYHFATTKMETARAVAKRGATATKGSRNESCWLVVRCYFSVFALSPAFAGAIQKEACRCDGICAKLKLFGTTSSAGGFQNTIKRTEGEKPSVLFSLDR